MRISIRSLLGGDKGRIVSAFFAMLLFGMTMCVLSVHAQDAFKPTAIISSHDSLTVAEVIRDVLKHNDRIAAARYMQEASERKISVAGAWDDPMLMLGVVNLPTSFDFKMDPMTMKMIGLSQNIPYAGQKGLQSKAARAEADAAAADRHAVEVDMAKAARFAFADLYYRSKSMGDLASQHELLRDVVASAKAKLTTSQGNQEEFLAVAGRAQSSGADSLLSLEQVVSAVREQNALVRSSKAMWDALKERPARARALPNPMLSYRGMNRAGDGLPWGKEEKNFEIEQEFPWFGKRGLRGQVALREAEAQGYEYQTMVQDAVLMAKETYFELYSVQRSLAITRAQETLLRQVETIALTKYEVGEVTQQDVIKAQAEISMLGVQLNDLTQQEAALKATLNQLLNRPAQTPLGIAATAPPKDFTLTPEELAKLAQQNRPEVLQARVNIERGQAERNLMNKEFWPDYRLGLEYRSLRDMDDLVMVQVSIDLPLWRGKYKAGAREATKMVESAKLSLEAAERQTSADVQSAFFRLQSAQRTFDLYDKSIITQAEARFDASEAGYRTGRVGFLELLESERFLLDTRVAAAMAEGQLGMALARLERATGLDLMSGSPTNQRP